jgi:hyperosmotically inducible protein
MRVMKRSIFLKSSILQLSLALCLGASAAAAMAADARAPLERDEPPRVDRDNDNSRTVGTTIDDAAITAKVKTALFTDELTKAWDINVDTVRSVVTLRGRVGSQAEAERAERVANSTAGVSSVRNELEVGR